MFNCDKHINLLINEKNVKIANFFKKGKQMKLDLTRPIAIFLTYES